MHSRNVLEAINETVGKVVCWVDSPLIASAMMRRFQYSIGCQIPHLRISIREVLLHSQECFLGFVFPVLHALELSQGLGYRPIAVNTRSWLASLLPSVNFDFLL